MGTLNLILAATYPFPNAWLSLPIGSGSTEVDLASSPRSHLVEGPYMGERALKGGGDLALPELLLRWGNE